MRQEERRARTRATLLRAAATAFAARGYDGASVDAIAASVGLSKGAVYAHFPSKIELYFGVVDALIEQAELAVGHRRRALHDPERAHQRNRHPLAPDAEVFEAALRLRAPQPVSWNLDWAEGVGFGAGISHRA